MWLRAALAVSIVALWVMSCSSILGIDDREEIPRPTGSGAANGGAGGSGATTTQGGGGATSVGGGGATGGVGGVGGVGGATGCSGNDDCASSTTGHVCNLTTKTCVECVLDGDCGAGQYCDTTANACLPGCSKNADCNLSGGTLTCDVATHTCHGCTVDASCPPGLLCDVPNQVCIAGCTDAHLCQAGRECCSGECADLSKDPAHCGLCGTACMAPGAVPECSAGACTWDTCLPGFGDCNGQKGDGCEIDLLHTAGHCGTCAIACATTHATPICSEGACAIANCNTGWADCDGDAANGCEVDTTGNLSNCGGCGNACDATHGTASCMNGSCAIACASGFGNCDGNPANGCETDVSASVNDCGACGTTCPAGGGTPYCVNSICGSTPCGAGTGNCDGDPTNGCETSLDSLTSCGACGVVCAPAHATGAACPSGNCVFTGCSAGWGDCDNDASDGCETSTSGDALNCGSCGSICNPPNATGACINGQCGIANCASGWADCDGNPTNGCEKNLNTSVDACGSCANACSFPNAGASCAGGQCQLGACNPGYDNCNGSPSDGCETQLGTTANCSACGNACNLPHANAVCTNAQCAIQSCQPGYGNCNGSAADGCEADLLSNVNHCGNCTTTCPTSGGVPNCVNGVCGFATCAPGTADCDSNGTCETNTTSDANNCGGCGVHCVVANGVGSCSGSTCHVASCNAPYADCDGAYPNGCEVNTGADPSHCGSCTGVCSTVNDIPSCSGGSCSISCNPGWGDCDKNVATGCEASLMTTANCLTCDTVCGGAHGTPSCIPKGCAITCDPNYFDCNQQLFDGCETNCTTINATSAACGGGPGKCSFICFPNFADCDGLGGNGCEADLGSSTANCGFCGNACFGVNTVCTGGKCDCVPGYGDCDSSIAGCESALNTVQHCGSCTNPCNLFHATAAACQTGACKFTCANGYRDCDGNGANGCEWAGSLCP